MEKNLQEIIDIAELMPGYTVIYKYDGELKRIFYSSNVPSLTGYSQQEYQRLEKENPESMILLSDMPLIREKLQEAIRTNGSLDVTYRLLHKTGKLIWVRSHANYMGKLEGCPVFLTSTFDVTDENDRQMALLENSDRGIAVFDKETKEILGSITNFVG